MEYNLIDEPWIPVLYHDGRWERVGIRRALLEAGEIRQIAASNPMDRVAIIRFLLAVLYWCKGNPPPDLTTLSKDGFPSEWFTKLDENRDCFNLLGEGRRFFQYRGAEDAKNVKLAANYLIQEVPTGTNMWHFRHSTDEVNGLCRACCVMGLLRLPLFATSGGRGKPPGVNSKPPIYVITLGSSLGETLLQSWLPVSSMGTPAWVKPDLQLPRSGEVPFLLGLTWLPRRVWLDDPQEIEGPCISCGRKERLVLRTVFAPIGSTKVDDNGPGRVWVDPHVIYLPSAKGEVTSIHASDALGASDAATGQWTKVLNGILHGNERGAQPRSSTLWIIGFSTVKNDKYLEATESFLPSPFSSQRINECIEKVERWQRETSSLSRRVRPPSEEPSTRKYLEIPPVIDAIRPHVESRVSGKIRDLLTGSDEAWDLAAQEYRPMMETVAGALSPGYTTSALQRRRQISSTIPDMRTKAVPDKKPGQKKGGNK